MRAVSDDASVPEVALDRHPDESWLLASTSQRIFRIGL